MKLHATLAFLSDALHLGVAVVLVYGARLLLIISWVRISNLYKSTLWWAYLSAPDTPSLLKRPIPLRNG